MYKLLVILFILKLYPESMSTFINTAWKVSKYGVFLVRICPHSDWIRRDIPYLSIQSESGKIRTRKTSVFGHFSRSERNVLHVIPVCIIVPCKRRNSGLSKINNQFCSNYNIITINCNIIIIQIILRIPSILLFPPWIMSWTELLYSVW